MPDTTFMRELNGGKGAAVDARVVPLVKFLNRLGVTTVSSGFGQEGFHVAFAGDYRGMAELLFGHVRAMTRHIEGFSLEMLASGESLIGVIRGPEGSLDEASRRIGGWMEIMGK